MHKPSLFIILTCSLSMLQAAGRDSLRPIHQISVVGGLIHDTYNSGGVRLMVQYQHRIKNTRHWFWGLGYDSKLAMYRPATDIYNPPELNTQNISVNLHYQRFIWKNRIGWDLGAGPALVLATENQRYRIRSLPLYGMHLSANLNIRLTRKIYFQTAPLLFIPFGSDFYLLGPQAYPSPAPGYSRIRAYLQYSVIPLGLRFEL